MYYAFSQKRPNWNVAVILHDLQRYNTVGDYYWDEAAACWQVCISQMPDPREEQLIAIHELTELAIVVEKGIPQADIDAFDVAFEEAREAGRVPSDAEPGDQPEAPYHQAHKVASEVERQLAEALGVDWGIYSSHCLSKTRSRNT